MKSPVRISSCFCFAVLLILLGFAVRASAQSRANATLAGVITDPRGAAIEGAQVGVELLPSAASQSTTPAAQPQRILSTDEGQFRFTLAPGRYRLIISHDSFSQVAQEITLAAGETRELPIHMTLEPLSSSVVVTAEAIPLDIESSPAPVTILTNQDINQRDATSLPDLLATLPGASLGRTGSEGGRASLFLDGGNSNYTKVLVDGVPVNPPGGLIDLSNFTVDNVEKIEVVHGAESALYGSDAMDGVIQIFTHRGTTPIPEFTAFADGGNFSTGHGGAELSGLLGRFDYSSAFSDLETSGQGPNDAFRNRTLSGNFGWRFSDTARIDLSLRDNDSNAGTPGPTLLQSPALYDNTGLHNFSAGLHSEFTTGSHWHHQLNGTESYNREFDGNPSSFSTTFLQYNRAAVDAQSTYLDKGLAATAGYEYEVENGFISYIDVHARRNNMAGFLDVRWQPLARLTLSAGARAEDNSYFGTRVVPRVGASYALRIAQAMFGDTRLRASYGQGIVEPRFDQSYGLDPCFPGNPNLAPEESNTVHAGVEQKLASDRLLVTADYFYSHFHNIISFDYGTPSAACVAESAPYPATAGTYFNTNLARAEGANLSGQARITHWLSATANYTYDSTRTLSAPTDPLNIDPNYLPGSRLLRRPVNSGNVVLNASYRRMNWNLAGYFTGQRFDYNYPGQVIDPGYALLNLAASYNVSHGLSVYGRIMNLANKQYEEAYGFPALGREYRIGLKYTTRHE